MSYRTYCGYGMEHDTSVRVAITDFLSHRQSVLKGYIELTQGTHINHYQFLADMFKISIPTLRRDLRTIKMFENHVEETNYKVQIDCTIVTMARISGTARLLYSYFHDFRNQADLSVYLDLEKLYRDLKIKGTSLRKFLKELQKNYYIQNCKFVDKGKSLELKLTGNSSDVIIS